MPKLDFSTGVLDRPLICSLRTKCRNVPLSMERKDNLPQRVPSSTFSRQITGGTNLTSSSSSSYSSASPPDFLSQVHAALKHWKPLAGRAVRMIDPPGKQSMISSAFALPSSESNAGKDVRQTLVPEGATKLTNKVNAEIGTTPYDLSITPPSDSCTLTGVNETNVKSNSFDLDCEIVRVCEKASVAAVPSPLELDSQLVLASVVKQVQSSSSLNEPQTFQIEEGVLGDMINVDKQDLYQQGAQNMEMSNSAIPFAGSLEKGKEQSHSQHCCQPETRCTLALSSCAMALSVDSGLTSQCTSAPLLGQSAFPTQKVVSASLNLAGIVDPIHPDGKRVMISEGSSMQDKQGLPNSEDVVKREVADNTDCLQSQAASTINSTSKLDINPPQPSKAEKTSRRKKYDSNVFFSVNGKLYQKLGKIGSGGSSEVHKVISADCSIYALKKIKLKGRDYATAYGFCQEIGYLNKLKGKNNIIELIDYEVTNKTLLQQAMDQGSITSKDGRIKDDEYIYMVLEYGEIDLAHMLMQKCRDMDSLSWNIDENWLRFYWQQMLEAVNTIHEERIVHSDLKPANFLLVRGSLKLIDFGIAKAIMSDTTNIQRDAQVGTLNYMSPEAFMWNEQDQTGGTIKCGRPSDIWSLGCILYQMVYGKTPFSDYKTFWSKFKVITDKNHKISYEPVTNPWLVDLMKRCLSWDRDKRWRISQLLQHPFLVPPVPSALPSKEDHPYKVLFDRAGLYWNEPEVTSLCSELHCVVSRLEKLRNSNDVNQPRKPDS